MTKTERHVTALLQAAHKQHGGKGKTKVRILRERDAIRKNHINFDSHGDRRADLSGEKMAVN